MAVGHLSVISAPISFTLFTIVYIYHALFGHIALLLNYHLQIVCSRSEVIYYYCIEDVEGSFGISMGDEGLEFIFYSRFMHVVLHYRNFHNINKSARF